jgi:hypothetical protein
VVVNKLKNTMKTIKNTFTTFLILLLVVPVSIFVTTPKAEAACSEQGLISSGGNCAKSYFNNTGYMRSSSYYDDNENENEYNNFGSSCENNNFSSRCYGSEVEHLRAIIVHLQAILDSFKNYQVPVYGSDAEINITTVSASNVNEDGAKLRGEVDFNDSDTAEVWFEYGKNKNNLSTKTTKIELDDSDSESFSKSVNNLNDDTLYYFRAVGRDDSGYIDRGSILSFRTDGGYSHSGDGNDNLPVVVTDEARNITDDSAKLMGSVDMNDFDNGNVFFVYGQDRNMIQDVESDFDTYSEVDESGDDLQKVLVDSGLDNEDDYTYTATELDNNTNYYFSMCVEYEDEDNNEKIICGNVVDFETDN